MLISGVCLKLIQRNGSNVQRDGYVNKKFENFRNNLKNKCQRTSKVQTKLECFAVCDSL